jgi:cytosine/adenosine deaminase-related metal-dependent hydrolase
MRAAGVTVGLAVDGSGTEHASMWLEARTALLLGRVRKGSTGMSARDVLEMATLGSAKCLGREGQLGVLRPGACGDLVCWPQEGIPFAGALTDPVEAWIRCGPTSARHTVVAGKAIVRDGELQLRGIEDRLNRHTQISREWQEKYV